MTSPAATLTAISTALDGVTGLRPQVKAGKANTPAAIVEMLGLTYPSALGGSVDYQMRVRLLVQLGEFRNSLERVWEFVDPDGTTATSALVALQSVAAVGDVRFEAGDVEWDGQSYAGGVFEFTAYG
jgi:hypothetical protein